jgi:hypothetical protein
MKEQGIVLSMDKITIKTLNPKCVQISNLQHCFTTPNKNLGEEEASDRLTPAAKSLYRTILKKRRHLGFGVFIVIWSMVLKYTNSISMEVRAGINNTIDVTAYIHIQIRHLYSS